MTDNAVAEASAKRFDIEKPTGKLTPEEVAERTRSFVGYWYEYHERYYVSREKIREFARAVQASNPVHHDLEAAKAQGYRDLVAPSTFFSIFGILAHRPLFDKAVIGYGMGQVMQSEQKVVNHNRPILAGDTLVCQVHLDGFRQAAGVDLVVTRNEVYDEHGEHLITSYTTLVGKMGTDDFKPEFYSTAEKVMMNGTA